MCQNWNFEMQTETQLKFWTNLKFEWNWFKLIRVEFQVCVTLSNLLNEWISALQIHQNDPFLQFSIMKGWKIYDSEKSWNLLLQMSSSIVFYESNKTKRAVDEEEKDTAEQGTRSKEENLIIFWIVKPIIAWLLSSIQAHSVSSFPQNLTWFIIFLLIPSFFSPFNCSFQLFFCCVQLRFPDNYSLRSPEQESRIRSISTVPSCHIVLPAVLRWKWVSK